MHRRRFLAAGGVALGAATAGCSGLFATGATGEPPVLEDRPDAVYVPTHVEGMAMSGMATAGPYRFALSYSFPHRFWLVTGERTRQVEVSAEDTMHLMLTAWDGETGTVVPTSNAFVTVSRDGDVVAEASLWSMLSQNMGVHFGDNVALDGDGTYAVTVDFGPVETRLAGPIRSERVSVEFDLEYSSETLEELSFERLDDRAGERGAVDPMGMEMLPAGQAPPAADLPGTPIGEEKSGDATFAVTTLEVPDDLDGSGTYLAVSVRTPHNRYPLPFMSLSAAIARDGEQFVAQDLVGTLHPGLGYHYGTVVDGVQSGDRLELTVESPPQVARHEGYETAFLGMDAVELTA